MKKKFDCIAMKRQAHRRIRAAVTGMNRREEVAYFRSGAADFARRLNAAKTGAFAKTSK
jgi:hypothetical protein